MLRECTPDKNANIFLDDNVTRCANGKVSGANLKSFASVWDACPCGTAKKGPGWFLVLHGS